MARLTIRQASQQGFASTLTIHRHIKDGSLPVYEDGDVKLLEVDDLITVFGEPGTATSSETLTAPANGRVDIHEFNRLKTELEQKNRKNMWLAADLAEVVRELKEKEAKFEQERTRLLTVLEQAQALLLREVDRVGGRKRAAASAAPTAEASPAAQPLDAVAGTQPEREPRPATAEAAVPPPAPSGATAAQPVKAEEPLVLDTILIAPIRESGKIGHNGAETRDSVTAGLPPLPPEGAVPLEHMLVPEAREGINPLMPPLEDPDESRHDRRILGTTTWLLLFALVGGGFAFFEFRTKVMMGVNKLLQALS